MEPTIFDMVLACVYAIPCVGFMILAFATTHKQKKDNITILRIGK